MRVNKNLITAIDIGDYSIKIIQLRKMSNNIKIVFIKKIVTAGEVVKNGEIISRNRIQKYFKKISMMGQSIKKSKLVTTFSNKNLILRNIQLPLMSKSDIKQVIKLGISDYIPYSLPEVDFRYCITEKNKDKIKIMLMAVKKNILNSYVKPFYKEKLKLEVINIQPMALISLLEYKNQKLSPVIIVNIGFKSTSLIIGDNCTIYLIRTINTGGDDFTREISRSYGMKYFEAEEFKKIKSEKIDIQLIYNPLKILIKEIKHALDFYYLQRTDIEISNLYLTGGGAKITGIINYLQKNLNLNICYLRLIPGLEDNKRNDEFSVAAGLAISEVLTDEN
ncbi:MAG: type IV pilus assembly protein PilM [Halanaerobiaceae bacterium]